MKTAVEWLEGQIRYYISNDDRLCDMFKQAKEMEKDVIMNSYNNGCRDVIDVLYHDGKSKTSEQYYNETYKKTNEEV